MSLNTVALVMSSVALLAAVLSTRPWRWRAQRQTRREHHAREAAALQQIVDEGFPLSRRNMRRYQLTPRPPVDLSNITSEDANLLRRVPSNAGAVLSDGRRVPCHEVRQWRQTQPPTESA